VLHAETAYEFGSVGGGRTFVGVGSGAGTGSSHSASIPTAPAARNEEVSP
jgi:hypothetical protein